MGFLKFTCPLLSKSHQIIVSDSLINIISTVPSCIKYDHVDPLFGGGGGGGGLLPPFNFDKKLKKKKKKLEKKKKKKEKVKKIKKYFNFFF